MSRIAGWIGGKLKEAAVEGYHDLKPTLAAGLQDLQRLSTTMDAQGTNLAGIASVPGQPGVMTQADANAAVHWAERNPAEATQQPEAQAEAEPQMEAAD